MINETRILDGMGELPDQEIKTWAKANLLQEFTSLAKMYKEMPLIK